MTDKDYKGKRGADGDDYKPLKFYQDRITGVENGFDHFSEGDEHFFTYNLDGQVVLISESYTSEKGRDNGIKSVDKNRVLDERYQRDSIDDGRHFFNLIAGNYQEIATSAWFTSEAAMAAAIDRIQEKTTAPLALGSIFGAAAAESAPTMAATPQPTLEPKPAASVEEEEKGCNCGWLWWLLPLLLLLLAWYLFSQCCNRPEPAAAVPAASTEVAQPVAPVVTSPPVADPAPTPTAPAITAPAPVPDASLGDFFVRGLPSGEALNIPEFGIENNLIQFIEDDSRPVDKTTWFNFDRINFDVGKADLTLDSREQIRNIALIMQAYPEVNIKIGGYTDNTGSAAFNQQLSQDRAESVMNALISQGVFNERLEAEGYGSQHPVATNETEEGRAQNRRIAVRVTKR